MTILAAPAEHKTLLADTLQARIAGFVMNFVAAHDETKLAAGTLQATPCATALRLLCGLRVLEEYQSRSGVANPTLAKNSVALQVLKTFAARLRNAAAHAHTMTAPYRFLFFAMKMSAASGEADQFAAAIDVSCLPTPAKEELPAYLTLAAELGGARGAALLQKTGEQFLKENPVDIGVYSWALSRLAFRMGWLWAALYFAVQAGNVGRSIDELVLGGGADDSYLSFEWPSRLPPDSGPHLPLADLPPGAILCDIAEDGTIVVFFGRYVVVRPGEWAGNTDRLAQIVQRPMASAVHDSLEAARSALKAS